MLNRQIVKYATLEDVTTATTCERSRSIMSEVINSAGSSPHSNLTAMYEAEQTFRQNHPTYESTMLLDELRIKEYGRLDKHGHIYLDYTGGGLYAESQLRKHIE